MIQWRSKNIDECERKIGINNRWKNHSAVSREYAPELVQSYNDHSTMFEYRIAPAKRVDKPGEPDKVTT